jgi:GcpE protein
MAPQPRPFDMDTVVSEIKERIEPYDGLIEVSVLGSAPKGIGEARHADFGITGAKDTGMIYAKGQPLRTVPTEQLVKELFTEIDKYYAAGSCRLVARGLTTRSLPLQSTLTSSSRGKVPTLEVGQGVRIRPRDRVEGARACPERDRP